MNQKVQKWESEVAGGGCVAGGREPGGWWWCGERWGAAWWHPELHLSPINSITVALRVCTRMEAPPDTTCAPFNEKSVLLSSGPFHFFFQTQESLCGGSSSRRLCDMMSSRFVFAFYCSDFAPSSVFLRFLLPSERAKTKKKKAPQKEARMKHSSQVFPEGILGV